MMPLLNTQYNSLSELQDLIIHMERFSIGVQSKLYSPVSPDILNIAEQLEAISKQLRQFYQAQVNSTDMKTRY